MQQPMNQPEPIGGQQGVQQQMVLCPVRFVYETQVLVQPGDQIQPNQTFFINPQNPPPWMQNRPAPNPMVYVQQLPNNMLQPVQQSMDQNQLYLQQNFANFQLQQHMLAQNHQEMRPMQLANIVPNMVQNVQQSIQGNERNISQNPNTGQLQTNTQNMIQNQMTVARQVPNQGNQTVEVQRQVQFMNVRPQMGQQMNIARPMMSLNQLQNMQAMANMQNLQIQQANVGQTFVQNLGQRMPQNVNPVRPQTMPNNAINVLNANNVKLPLQEANKAMTNVGTPAVPNVRNFAQNYNSRPIQSRRRFTENNANVPKMQQQNMPVQQQKIQQQTQNLQQQQHIQQLQNQQQQNQQQQNQQQQNQQQQNQHQQNQQQHLPVVLNTQQQQNLQQLIPVSQIMQQNQQQLIPVSQTMQQNLQQLIPVSQTMQLQQNQQQFIPVSQTMQLQQNQQQHIPVQPPPTQQQHQYNQDKVISHQFIANLAANTAYLNNQNISRKRKSESPDEIQDKIAIPTAAQPFYKHQQGVIVSKLCEMGTNTSPIHKAKLNVSIANNQPLQINQSTPMVLAENIEQIKQDGNQIKNETRTVITPALSENDKLIRNTVFTQARSGRLLQDKISENLPQVIENKPPESVQNTTDNNTNPDGATNTDTVMAGVPKSNDKYIKVTIQSESGTAVTKAQADTIESRIIQILESIPKNKNTQTTEDKPAKVKKEEVSKEDKIANVKSAENNVSNENDASQAIKIEPVTKIEPQEEQSSEVKDENKGEATERVLPKQDILTHVVDGYVIQESNFAFPIRKPLIEKTLQANPKAESESIDALKECMKEEMKNTGVDVQLLPFHYLLLHCEQKKEEEEMENSKKLDPFTDLLQSTVKSWTTEDLSNHLLKYDWNETVSVFQDHEMDGESLFLVSKPQLVSIGVNEENAETICAFVRS